MKRFAEQFIERRFSAPIDEQNEDYMRPLPDTAALHTEADNMPALSKDESRYMGRQVVPAGTVNPSAMAVYGEIESSVENEDQVNMHHAEPDEHL